MKKKKKKYLVPKTIKFDPDALKLATKLGIERDIAEICRNALDEILESHLVVDKFDSKSRQ